jgi:multiple sugar transport system permease protein
MTETITEAVTGSAPVPVQPQFVRRRPRRSNSDAIQLRVLATPSIVILCLIGVYPIIYAVYQSLRSGTLISSGSFVGLANYKYVLTNSTFWSSARFTLIFTLAAVVGSYLVGLALALTFQAGFPGARIIKPLLLLPWVVPVVVSMTSWGWLIGTGQGLADEFTHALGLGDVGFLATPTNAVISVSVVKIWESFPFMLLVLGAAMETIDPTLYEAARVDGAGWWASTRHITLPLLRNVSFMTWILMAIFSVNDFPTVWLLTGGGPVGATQSLVVYAYELVFQEFHTGQGIAIAIFATLIAGGMAIGLFRFLNPGSTRTSRRVAR